MTHEKIPLAGVLGAPIAHSRSPLLHNFWLKRHGLRGAYVPLHVEQSDLERVLAAMPLMGFVGCNVTLPHKVSVLNLATSVSDRAALIGAANTLTFREGGGIIADNTDGYGFINNLRQNAPDWAPRSGPATLFGAGGAARAIITALIEAGVPEIRLTNRTRARSEALRKEFGARITVYDWVQAGNMFEDAATVINTTSLGMEGKAEFRVPLDGLSPRTLVTDVVYTPLETTLLRRAREIGCPTVDGLGMLLHQAVPAFERWFGERPQVDEETRETVMAG